MISLPNLEAKEGMYEVAFHLKGLIEAAQEVTTQTQILDAAIDNDLDIATDALGAIEAEIYTHLAYHVKELRKPFSRLFRMLCRELDKQEKARGKDPGGLPGGDGRKRGNVAKRKRKEQE